MRVSGKAEEHRLGAEVVRAMLLPENRADVIGAASGAPDQQGALDRVVRLTASLTQGNESASVSSSVRPSTSGKISTGIYM